VRPAKETVFSSAKSNWHQEIERPVIEAGPEVLSVVRRDARNPRHARSPMGIDLARRPVSCVPGDGGMPQRISVISDPASVLRITGIG
jgi:hypothetical protein